jgi:hypothetical protein
MCLVCFVVELPAEQAAVLVLVRCGGAGLLTSRIAGLTSAKSNPKISAT